MKTVSRKVTKPVSLAGCKQILEKAGISQNEYSQWGIGKIFDEAERLAKENSIFCEEVSVKFN